ncbi:OmpA family protein [Streptomyces sp. NPDC001212]
MSTWTTTTLSRRLAALAIMAGLMLGVAASSHRSSFGLAPLRSSARLAPPKILDPPRTRPASAGWSGDQDDAVRRTDTNTEVTYELQAEVLCTKDSARLSDAARSRITAIAREIEQRTATRVRVSGFTDNLGSSVHGDVLSKQRASAVRAALAAELRSTTVVFETQGFEERHAVASNTTEADRKKNRRVEVSFA